MGDQTALDLIITSPRWHTDTSMWLEFICIECMSTAGIDWNMTLQNFICATLNQLPDTDTKGGSICNPVCPSEENPEVSSFVIECLQCRPKLTNWKIEHILHLEDVNVKNPYLTNARILAPLYGPISRNKNDPGIAILAWISVSWLWRAISFRRWTLSNSHNRCIFWWSVYRVLPTITGWL